MRRVDVYLLDWNSSRPRNMEGVWKAANAGRYEYSFTIQASEATSSALDYAYHEQGNNAEGRKVRADRQSMSMYDVAVCEGAAFYCATVGWTRVPGLELVLLERMQRSWDAWTDDGDAANSAREFERLLRRLATVDAKESWRGNDDEIEFLRSAVDVARRALGLPEPTTTSEPAVNDALRTLGFDPRGPQWVVDPEELDVPNPDLLASNGDSMRKAERGG